MELEVVEVDAGEVDVDDVVVAVLLVDAPDAAGVVSVEDVDDVVVVEDDVDAVSADVVGRCSIVATDTG